ncbi:MAG: ATP-binding protein [Planctomycetota bacterium]|nr:ATP-binding protein [Planctomycetota bacterium]
MRQSKHFLRLAAGQAVLIALTTAVLGSFVLSQASRSIERGLRVQLESQALLLLPAAVDDFARFLGDQEFAQVYRDQAAQLTAETRARVTYIRRSGEVVFDTEADGEEMENHGTRPEVLLALEAGQGSHQRRSRTLDLDHFYLARTAGPEGGVVRVSLPMDQYSDETDRLRASTIVGALLAGLLSVGLGLWFARSASLPLQRVSRAAEALRKRELPDSEKPQVSDEVELLGQTLSDLSIELKEKIEALAADEAQMRAMIAGMVEGVLAVDANNAVTFSNRAAREFLGLPAEHLGASLESVSRAPGLEALVEVARGSDTAASSELQAAQGGRSLLVKAHRFVAVGRTGVVLVFEDVTELRRLERVRRDFVANVSHELKTPLTSIRGFVETLLDGALEDPDNNRRFLDKIDTNVSRLGSLVSDLLSLARIESAHEGLNLIRVDWRAVTDACVRRHEAHARAKDIELSFDDGGNGSAVLGEEEALTQVVDNLLDNALKYTPKGGSVRVSLRAEAEHVHLTVRDTGIGIPPTDLERIFERFYRVDKARSRELGGTGLGLSIVKHLVTSLEGELAVTSEEGVGSEFTVTLNRA